MELLERRVGGFVYLVELLGWDGSGIRGMWGVYMEWSDV